eukprot:4493530-Amphidinium_carterae.5
MPSVTYHGLAALRANRSCSWSSGIQHCSSLCGRQLVMRSCICEVITRDEQPSADVSTDLCVHLALRRRAVAYGVSRVIPFEASMEAVEHLWGKYLASPIQGFGRVSVEQIRAADEYIFLRLSELTKGGRSAGTPVFPCERILRIILQSLELAASLLFGSSLTWFQVMLPHLTWGMLQQVALCMLRRLPLSIVQMPVALQ